MMREQTQENWDLRKRTTQLALRIIRLSSMLPDDLETTVIRRQLIRSGTSVGAQYREACRARSASEFRSKMQSSLQELDETAYWLELLVESDRVSIEKLQDLLKEVDELIAIFVASIRTSMRQT
jgi:four helix bundle protein